VFLIGLKYTCEDNRDGPQAKKSATGITHKARNRKSGNNGNRIRKVVREKHPRGKLRLTEEPEPLKEYKTNIALYFGRESEKSCPRV